MSDFARLYTVDGHQVLFYIEPDPDMDDAVRVNQITMINGITANLAVSGIKEDKGLLDRLTEEQARIVFNLAKYMIESE